MKKTKNNSTLDFLDKREDTYWVGRVTNNTQYIDIRRCKETSNYYLEQPGSSVQVRPDLLLDLVKFLVGQL